MGMLAWFVNMFVVHKALTPNSILILFITSVLALAWTLYTFSYHHSSHNASLVALVDFGIFGILFAAVQQMGGISNADCVPIPALGSFWYPLVDVPGSLGWPSADMPCSMVKACWAFAIVKIFFATAYAAFRHGDHFSAPWYDDECHHCSHHHHRHHSHLRNRSPTAAHGACVLIHTASTCGLTRFELAMNKVARRVGD